MKKIIKTTLDKATDYKGSKKRKIGKGVLGAVIVILLGALGLEAFNSDFDLGSIFSGESVSDSKITRDEKGNLNRNEEGSFVTRVLRDKEGKVVSEGEEGGKYTDEYNCDDFGTQSEAQKFFINAGGLSSDTNRLDGDKDGDACESLPKGSNQKAKNGETILTSQGYASKGGCKNGIESVRKNSVDDSQFERKVSSNRKQFFNIIAKNKEIVGTSEMYESTSSRDNGIKSVSKNAPVAEISEVDS